MIQRYVHGSNAAADDPLVWYSGSNLNNKQWLHADHLGSIVGVTNASGGNPSINTYDEYGIPGSGNSGRFQYNEHRSHAGGMARSAIRRAPDLIRGRHVLLQGPHLLADARRAVHPKR